MTTLLLGLLKHTLSSSDSKQLPRKTHKQNKQDLLDVNHGDYPLHVSSSHVSLFIFEGAESFSHLSLGSSWSSTHLQLQGPTGHHGAICRHKKLSLGFLHFKGGINARLNLPNRL